MAIDLVMTGVIPHAIGQLGKLMIFEARDNQLSGNDSHVMKFQGFKRTHILGPIPTAICDLTALVSLNLKSNCLTGRYCHNDVNFSFELSRRTSSG